MMATIPTTVTGGLAEQNFCASLKTFQARLSAQERREFQFATLNDLRRAIQQVQSKQAARSEAMHLARLGRVLEGFEQFGQVVEIFLNTSNFVAFIWGPMKFLILVASNFVDAFDTLLSAYEQIGESIPLIGQYRSLFPDNNHMKEALSKIYEDILEFHKRALRFFTLHKWQQFFKCVWKDFDHAFKHILQDLRQHKALIESQANVLHFQQYQADRLRLLDDVERHEVSERKNQYTEVLQWASVAESLQDHEDICAVRSEYPGSGNWLLQNLKYRAWREDSCPSTPTLWLHGIPGAGKTVLASFIIEHCQLDTNAETTYFYCKHDDPHRTMCVSILRTLICQCLRHDHDLLPWIYEQYLTSGQLTLTSIDLCKKLLEVLLLHANKVYLVIDGLDECESQQRKMLLQAMTRMIEICEAQNPGKVRLLIVSQDEVDIRRNIPVFSELRLQSTDNQTDIENYTKIWCKKIQDKFELSDDERMFIYDLTYHRAEGMFLFVKLVVQNLYDQATLATLREQIQPCTFPAGLGQAYQRIRDRIMQRSPTEQSLATSVLGWMICARRPLRWREIQGISCIDIVNNDVNFTERQLRVHIREVCGSLVAQLSGDRLELVHNTAKHYLIETDFVQPLLIECRLATLCLTYLSMRCFDSDVAESERLRFLLDGYFAFQDYAVTHWSDHLSRVIKNGSKLICHKLSETEVEETLGCAVIDFVAKYEFFNQKEAAQGIDISDCDIFAGLSFWDDLTNVAYHIALQRAKGAKALEDFDPQPLEAVVLANRHLLEGFASSTSLDLSTKSKLVTFYGKNWYRCSKVTCFYFHEGFEENQTRHSHMVRHDKPFRCPLQDCETGFKLGFTTKKDLDKHLFVYHPELGPACASFSRLRKSKAKNENDASNGQMTKQTKHPASHACHLCPKRFTRAGILKTHLSTHNNEKPYECSQCSQRFVRENDRKRHERGHSGQNKVICKAVCTDPPKDHGCGKEFPRADALINHWRRGAGKACIAPLMKEQSLRRQWEAHLEEIKIKGPDVPIPPALRERYPDVEFLDWHRILTDPDIGDAPDTSSDSGTPSRSSP